MAFPWYNDIRLIYLNILRVTKMYVNKKISEMFHVWSFLFIRTGFFPVTAPTKIASLYCLPDGIDGRYSNPYVSIFLAIHFKLMFLYSIFITKATLLNISIYMKGTTHKSPELLVQCSRENNINATQSAVYPLRFIGSRKHMFPNIHDERLSEIVGWYISILDYIYYDQTINSSGH